MQRIVTWLTTDDIDQHLIDLTEHTKIEPFGLALLRFINTFIAPEQASACLRHVRALLDGGANHDAKP